jgi:hypothetical protein
MTYGQKKDGGGQLIEAYPRCLEGGDFVITGKPGEGNEHSQKQGDGDNQKEGRGEEIDEKLPDVKEANAFVDEKLGEVERFPHHEDDGKEQQADEKRNEYFLR